MYIRAHHQNTDFTKALELIKILSFGVLIANVKQRSWGVHLPFMVNTDQSLSSHMAKANPLAQEWLNEGLPKEVLCIFQGAGAYVSGSWYTQEEVSTYNYTALHVYSRVTLCTTEQTLSDLNTLMYTHEFKQKRPKYLNDYSSETLRQVHGILGFKLEVLDFYFVQKLSQERTEDISRVIEHLSQGEANEQAVAKDMQQLNNPL